MAPLLWGVKSLNTESRRVAPEDCREEGEIIVSWVQRFYWGYNGKVVDIDCGGASQGALVVKNPPANAGDIRGASLIPGLGRSSGGGEGMATHSSNHAWRIPMDSLTVHGVAKSWTRLKRLSMHPGTHWQWWWLYNLMNVLNHWTVCLQMVKMINMYFYQNNKKNCKYPRHNFYCIFFHTFIS